MHRPLQRFSCAAVGLHPRGIADRHRRARYPAAHADAGVRLNVFRVHQRQATGAASLHQGRNQRMFAAMVKTRRQTQNLLVRKVIRPNARSEASLRLSHHLHDLRQHRLRAHLVGPND